MKLPSPPCQVEVTEGERRPRGAALVGAAPQPFMRCEKRRESCEQRDIIGGIE
jgi:hypothetical protein